MHLTPLDGSQSPEGQTGAETYERGDLRIASSRSWTGFGRRGAAYPVTTSSRTPFTSAPARVTVTRT